MVLRLTRTYVRLRFEMVRWGRFAAAYAVLCAVALVLLWSRGSPLLHPAPRLKLDEGSAHLWSFGVGLAFGLSLVVVSRVTVHRYAWARLLHAQLRPFAQGLTASGILVLAVLSSAGEELLFRGLFQPWMGLIAQAALFGIVHQLPGPSRWIWVIWATLVGLALGVLYEVTGSLVGPLVAHAVVNGLNLGFLKRFDPEADGLGLGSSPLRH
jgi:membrane protease YdiL (CAAX protease family)